MTTILILILIPVIYALTGYLLFKILEKFQDLMFEDPEEEMKPEKKFKEFIMVFWPLFILSVTIGFLIQIFTGRDPEEK